MKKILMHFLLTLCLSASASNAVALTDSFYASGEDLDFIFDVDSDYVIEEIEHKLRKFVLYRKLEDLLLDLNDEYPGIIQ